MQRFAIASGGALLLAAAFPPFNVIPALFAGLALLIIFWSRLPWWPALLWGWLSGVILSGIEFQWLAKTVLAFGGIWSGVAFAAFCLLQGTVLAGTAAVVSLSARGEIRTTTVIAGAAGWTLFEFIRTTGPLGVPLGQLGSIALHMDFLLPLAAWGGSFLLSFIVALAASSVAAIVAGRQAVRNFGAMALGVILVIVVVADFSAPQRSPRSSALKVAVAQASVGQEMKWSPASFEYTMATYERLTRAASAQGATVIVWPETAITSYPLQKAALRKRLEELATGTRAWIFAGTIDRPVIHAYYNSLMELSPQGHVTGVYHKHLLLPFAEYLPWPGLLQRLAVFDDSLDLRRGPGANPLLAAGYRFGSMICYESAFPSYGRANVSAGADALIVATDDDWFFGTAEMQEQADIARLQAVATGRWLLRAAQSGVSEIIDPHGVVRAELPVGQQGFVTTTIGRGSDTLFDRYGSDWLIVLCALVVAAAVVQPMRLVRSKSATSQRLDR